MCCRARPRPNAIEARLSPTAASAPRDLPAASRTSSVRTWRTSSRRAGDRKAIFKVVDNLPQS